METERIRQIPPALTVKINKAEEMNYDPAAAAGCGGQPHQGRWNQGGRGAIASLDFGTVNKYRQVIGSTVA